MKDAQARRHRHRTRRQPINRTLRRGLWVILLLVLVIGFVLRDGLYNHFVRYPRQEAAWQAVRTERQPVSETAGWTEFRGILHSHSHLSHDCDVPFEDILKVLKAAGLDFIALSDHCNDGLADFAAQWRGLHEGKLFIPGFEMKQGFMPFGVKAGVVLTNGTDGAELARQIIENGGVLFYAHPEEPPDWDRPELTGMEIYNLHVDFKRHEGLLPDLLLNFRRYPEQVLHRISKRPVEFLERWDHLNQTRHITGIAANDCHQNVGMRGFYTAGGTLHVEDTGGKKGREYKLNWLTRPLAEWAFGPLEPGRKLFEAQIDPYERSARFVNTHVLARELTEPDVLDALRAGRVYIGFDMIADSSGFRWFAEAPAGTAVMGETMAFSTNTQLRAVSPLPCRFTVIHEGHAVRREEGRSLAWAPPEPGKYRVEAELRILNDWVPWVYANPIELKD